jgi:BirA family transcriptional regulator, biotin operon repressor / biotin---[acetyl-CoA-carboxylase] ligase
MAGLRFLDDTLSTNLYLQNLLEQPGVESGDAVATFNQTKGRGQKNNKWLSEPDQNLHYSIFYKPEFLPARNQFLISGVVALTVKTLLEEYVGKITIKWPNDLYHENQKMGGILIENRLKGSLIEHSIIGIGINVNQIAFPEELPNPVSLRQIIGKKLDLHEFAEKLHRNLSKAFINLNTENESDVRKFYVNSLYRRDGFHLYRDSNGEFKAKILDVTALGHLILQTEEGTPKEYDFKEVSFV